MAALPGLFGVAVILIALPWRIALHVRGDR
jgi:hypothetical protein